MKLRILSGAWINLSEVPAIAKIGESISIIPSTNDVKIALSKDEPTSGTLLVKLVATGLRLSDDHVESLWVYSEGGSYLEVNSAGTSDFHASSFSISDALVSKHLGYADYNDASTASAPVTLVADTWTTLPNDGLGLFTNESYLPSTVTTLLDAGGGIDISGLELGSDILIRPDFTVTPSANNSALFFRFSLGTGAGSYTLESSFGRLDLGAGLPYRHALQAMYVYAGDTNTRDNPVNLQIKLSGGGTVVNAGMAIKVLST